MRYVPSIWDLETLIGALPGEARERAERLFDVRRVLGRTDPPPEMSDWLRERFGSVEAVREQRIVKVTNRVTLEATLLAPLRARQRSPFTAAISTGI